MYEGRTLIFFFSVNIFKAYAISFVSGVEAEVVTVA